MQDGPLRVALIYPQGHHNIHMPIPPLSLAYLIKYYQTYGQNNAKVEFRIFDENAEHRNLIHDVADYHPHMAGITALSFTKSSADRCADQLRSLLPDIFIIGGGVHFQVCPTDGLLEKRYDVVCTGEGEEPFRSVIDDYLLNCSGSKSLSNIPNLAWLDANNCIAQSKQRFVADLVNNPLPDYEWFNRRYYFAFRHFIPRVYGRSATILTSRGCPFNCSFCFNSFRDRSVRKHDIRAIVDQMAHLRNKFRITKFAIGDDLFFMDRPRVKLFCERIITELPDIHWACLARPSILRHDDLPLMQLMKRSGCIQISYGMETGSEELLKKLKGPDSSISKNEVALDLAWRAGIPVFAFFMCGIPGETEEQMAMTRNFIKNHLDKIQYLELFVYTPYPGSKLAEEVRRMGILENISNDELSVNNLVEGKIKAFNPLVPSEKILKFRQEIKQIVIQKYSMVDKIIWLIVNTLDNPSRTFRRLKALYGRANPSSADNMQ